MKRKRKIIPGLSLAQNFRLVMTEEGLTFGDVARKSKVSQSTAYRIAERTPVFISDQLIRSGGTLGFSEEEIREKVAQEPMARGFAYSEKERFYRLISELIELFESKEK